MTRVRKGLLALTAAGALAVVAVPASQAAKLLKGAAGKSAVKLAIKSCGLNVARPNEAPVTDGYPDVSTKDPKFAVVYVPYHGNWCTKVVTRKTTAATTWTVKTGVGGLSSDPTKACPSWLPKDLRGVRTYPATGPIVFCGAPK